MIFLGILVLTLIVTVPVLLGIALLGALAWRLFALPIGPVIYWTAVCLLTLPATQFVFVALNGFEPSTPQLEPLTQLGNFINYGVLGLAWLGGLVLTFVLQLARPSLVTFTPRVAIAFSLYALVIVGLLVMPPLIQRGRATARAAFIQSVLDADLVAIRQHIEAGADPGRSYEKLGERNVMQYAIEKGQPELVTLLIELGPRGILDPLVYLAMAAEYGDLAVVMPFIDHGADINAGSGEPLRSAAQAKKLEVVRLLLERGADPNAKDPMGGWTALMESAYLSSPSLEIVELLLSHDADVSLQNNQGDTAIILAERQGNLEIVRVLRAAEERL